ncbi:MAG: DUF2975 domain-containing protein [Caulobacteraceae bacterium]|nr:DUF2975 domain-containing protein [Caulobacteraceae bacterium]
MRALGPGSVSSFLKIILDVVYVALWIGAGVTAILALGSLVFDIDPALFGRQLTVRIDASGLPRQLLTTDLFAVTAYAIGVLIIVDRLRRIFSTLTAGDPFHPDNVRRLRVVGVMLAALELGRYPVVAVTLWLAPKADVSQSGVNLTAWFAVLVVFVLAEVFREGARLRREAELTI